MSEQFNLRLDQSALLLPPANIRTLELAVQAVHCYPLNGKATSQSRRVMNALVFNARELYALISDEDKTLIRRVNGTPRFTITVKRLFQLIGREDGTNYESMYEEMSTLASWKMKWNVMDDKGEYGRIASRDEASFISHWGRGEGRFSGTIHYYMPHAVMMMLLEPSVFARVDIQCGNSFGKSHYAVELYLQCVRYIDIGQTKILELDEWIRLLAGPGRYEGRYKDFRRYALEPAMAVLKATDTCPFTVELREVRGPRNRIIALQFKLTPKSQPSLDMSMPVTWSPETLDVLRKVYSMTTREIRDLAYACSESEVQGAMELDRQAMTRKAQQGETVANRAKYLRGIIRNLQTGKGLEAEPEEEVPTAPSRSVQDAVARATKLQGEFENFKRKRLYEQLNDLPSHVLDDLRYEFEQAHGTDLAVAKSIKKGWDKPPKVLVQAFLNWFMAAHPKKVESLLASPHERDFNIWLLWHQAQDSDDSNTLGYES